MVSADYIIQPFFNHIIQSILFSTHPLCDIHKKEIVFNKLPTLSNLLNTIINRLILKSIPSFTFDLPKRVVNYIKYHLISSILSFNRLPKIIFRRHSIGGTDFLILFITPSILRVTVRG